MTFASPHASYRLQFSPDGSHLAVALDAGENEAVELLSAPPFDGLPATQR